MSDFGFHSMTSSPNSGNGYHAQFVRTSTQNPTGANQADNIAFDTEVHAVGIELVNNTDIKILYDGSYIINISVQFYHNHSSGGTHNATVWFSQQHEGELEQNVANSAKTYGFNNNDIDKVGALSFHIQAQANDVIRIKFSVTDTDVVLAYTAPVVSPSIPAEAAAEVIINQISST